MDSQQLNQTDLTIDVTFPSAQGLLSALSSIRSEKKQMCVVDFSADGLTVKWEHQSKALQSGIFLGQGVSSRDFIHQAYKERKMVLCAVPNMTDPVFLHISPSPLQIVFDFLSFSCSAPTPF